VTAIAIMMKVMKNINQIINRNLRVPSKEGNSISWNLTDYQVYGKRQVIQTQLTV
jgi:hypothetical protein